MCSKFPDHLFHSCLALLDEHELLEELKKEHFTLEPTDQVPLATGIPPHIDHAIALKKVYGVCTDVQETLDRRNDILQNSIFEAIDDKVKADGGVNSAILEQSLNSLKNELFSRIDALRNNSNTPTYSLLPLPEVANDVRTVGPFSFQYKGSSWCVPESFAFPQNMTRLVVWRKWLRGLLRVVGGQRWKIKPFRKFVSRDFPNSQLRTVFNTEWKTIFSKMMETPGLVIPTHEHNIDEAFVESSYASTTWFLREN